MTTPRKSRIFAVVLAALLTAPFARADDATELERAKASYDAGRYAEGVERFSEMLNPTGANALRQPQLIERARAYYAACLIALGRADEADAEIEKVIRNNPVYSPDPVAFPSKVIDRFIDAKGRLKGEIEAAFRARAESDRAARAKVEREQRQYIENLQKLAAEEKIVVRHSRWIAMIPFGAGQFQNGQDGLGYALLLSESALAITSIATDVIAWGLVSQYASTDQPTDANTFNPQFRTVVNVNWASTGAFAAIALFGVIHAQSTFVPEVTETRTRVLPKPPTLTPVVSPTQTGAVFGIGGRF